MNCCSNQVTVTEVSSLGNENTATTPQREKKPKDVLFLLLFVITTVGLGFLSNYSSRKGDPFRYINGTDSWGNVCGRNNKRIFEGVDQSGKDHSSRKYEFHMGLADVQTALSPISYLLSKTKPAVICVRECPIKAASCRDLLLRNDYNLSEQVIEKHVCTMAFDLILPHKSILNRCVPSQLLQITTNIFQAVVREDSDNSTNFVNNEFDVDVIQAWSASIAQSFILSLSIFWKDIIYLSAMSLGICLLVVGLMQVLTRLFLLISVAFGGCGSMLLTVYLWYSYAKASNYLNEEKIRKSLEVLPFDSKDSIYQLIKNYQIAENSSSQETTSDLTDSVKILSVDERLDYVAFSAMINSNNLLIWPIIATVFTFILFFILLRFWKSLWIVIKIFDEACLAVASMPSLLIEPIKVIIAYIAVAAFFVIISAYVLTIQDANVDGRGFVVFAKSSKISVPVLFLGHLFGCLWMISFISGCQQIILAGAVCDWFFQKEANSEKDSEEKSGLVVECETSHAFRSTINLALYNLGTAAFGSLILAFIQTIRVVLEYISNKLHAKKTKLSQNILNAFRCCLYCFEKFIKYVNRKAYICSAIYGYGFVKSAKKAFTLFTNNAQYAFALSCVGSICLFFAKVTVVSLTGIISIMYFVFYRLENNVLLSEHILPITIVSAASFLIAHCFFTVYQVAIDTIFLCFCDDQERNNGNERPYYSSARLQEHMDFAYKEKHVPKDSIETPGESGVHH